MILRARVVWPVSQPPIENGAVAIHGTRILSVGRWQEAQPAGGGMPGDESAVGLGDHVLLPGLINAHCHLDYTDLGGQLSSDLSFTDWIKSIQALKAAWTPVDYAQSWRRGARMLLDSGVTTVADIEAVPELLPELLALTPLRVFSFLEMIGPRPHPPAEEICRKTEAQVRALAHLPGYRGLSPHAPFSTTARLFELCRQRCRENGWRMTSHVSESLPEYDMFMFKKGSLFDWLKDQRGMSDCGQGSPVHFLERLGVLGDDFLAVHVNYLWDKDAQILGRRRVHVAHCPRSHEFFHHRRFPQASLADAGVNLCLGTDSLASVKMQPPQGAALSLFSEMQTMIALNDQLSPEIPLRMATVNGARALGLPGLIGEIVPGAFADLIALPFAGKAGDLPEAVVHHQGPVAASLIGGRWAVNRLGLPRGDSPKSGLGMT